MDIRFTNATGKTLYYKILDFEGSFGDFQTNLLPGMYPDSQSTYTDSDNYYWGTNTKMNEQQYTLSSRYPKFNTTDTYLSGNFWQPPSHQAFKEMQMLDTCREGTIKSGYHRDLLFKDINCVMFVRTVGTAEVSADDPRFYNYSATFKIARLREHNVIFCLNFEEMFYQYNAAGIRVQTDYTNDINFIPLNPLGVPVGTASVNAQPKQIGTYVGGLMQEHLQRKRKYAKRHPNMTAYNYSADYDDPDLGYFDRRFLNYQ
jgi:hypothetical protein